MKNFMKNIYGILPALLMLAFVGTAPAQQSLNGIRLQDANSHVVTIGAPTGGFTGSYNFRFPATVPGAGALMYSLDGVGQSTWLPAGGNGQVLSFSGGLPVWSSLSSLLSGLIEWNLLGNAVVLSYNGLIGSYLGTNNNQPLVLGTTSILTPQPIEFYTNNTEKMRLTSGGELGIGLLPTAGKLLHVAGTSGTSNVRLASLAGATGTTGRIMFATDATGDLQTLAFPGSSGQMLTSTTGGALSWVTPTTGTVTSVSVTVPSILSVAPATITTSGTFAITLANQATGNQIFASPNGASGTPTFRSMVMADLPSIASNTIIGNNTGGAATPSALTTAQVKTLLNLTGTNSGDVSLSGENYLSLAGQVITANAVNLSGTNVTGTLAAARFPALTGDVTTVAGALGTTIAANAVTYTKMQNTTAASVLLGRNSTGAGAIGEITLGSGLAMSAGGVLSAAGSGGTVTSVSVVTANGISGAVATPTTTPSITLTLGAITPTSVASTGTVTGSNLSGTNSGDVILAGTGTYLSLAGQAITQNPIDLSSANASGTLAAARFPALTGDVTTVAGALGTTIQPAAVTLAKLANLAANSIIGNNTGAAATPIALTTAQVKTMLNLTGTNSGDVSLAGTGTYLSLSGQAITQNPIDLSSANATGVLAAARFPALTGDVTTVAGALGATIANNAVTYTKMQNTTAASVLLGRNSTGAGAIGEITLGGGLSMSAGGVLSATGSGGTVTSVSVVTANGVSGVVANPTTTPAITLTLGAITPSSVVSTGTVTGSNLSGTNSGDVTLAGTGTYLSLAGQAITQNPIDLSSANASGILAAARFPALAGDITSVAGALATTIAANVVTYGKMQNTTAASVLLGRNSTGAGGIGEITLGAGLAMSAGGVLSASGGTLSGLTNKGAMYATGATSATSTAAMTDGQLLIGSTAGNPALSTLTGTVNQINVANASNSITLSTPQNIHTAATPQFAQLGLNQAADAIASIAATQTALGTTVTDGIILQNTTPATAIATQQYSPSLVLGGTAWKSNAPAASQPVEWVLVNEPQTGAAAPTTNLVIASEINNGGYWPCATFISGVALNLASGCAYQINGVNVLNSTTLGAGILNSSLTSVGTLTTGTWNATKISEVYGGTNQSSYATGDMLYASAANTLSKLPIGAAGYVLTNSGGLPSWQNPNTTNWQLAGNAPVAGYNGVTGSFIGTTNTQPLVLATTNTTTAQPIDFYTNNTAKMRLNANGFLSVGGTFAPNSPMHIKNSNANSSVLYLENTAANGYTSVDFKNDAGTVGNMGVSNSAAGAFANQYYFNISAGSVLPITFNQNTTEKLAIDLNGNTYVDNKLGVGFNSGTYATLQTAGRAFNVAGTAGTVNVRMTSLGAATPGTTGGVLYADANGDLNRLGLPAANQQVLASTTGGTLSWATALVIPLTNTTSSASTLLDLTNSGTGSGISGTASGASTSSFGIRGQGNGTTTDANSNVGVQILNGEFVVARQASSVANDNSSGNNILAAGEDDANGLSDQGPSGVVDIQDGGNPAGSSFSAGTLQVFNRYAKAHSIILITPMAGGTGTEGGGENIEYSVTARAAGSFTVQVRRSRAGGVSGTSGTWRVGFLIVNPGK